MRRRDREVTNIEDIIAIIDACKVFRVAFSVDNMPYIVPLNFGYIYEDGRFCFYFHCAKEGKKLDMLAQNTNVCFEMDTEHELIGGQEACDYGYKFSSIIGTGKIEVVENNEEKKKMLIALMKHQTGKDFTFTDQQVGYVAVCQIKVDELAAKRRTQ